MKQQLQAWFARVDALSVRERVFLFLSVVACCVALVDWVWLAPAMAVNKKLVQQVASQTAELTRLREEFNRVAQPVDPSTAVRDDIAAAGTRLEALNTDILTLLPKSGNAAALEHVLLQLLRRHDGLTLLGLKTLPAQMAVPGTQGAAAPATALPAGLTRTGLELQVKGAYSELVGYVKSLETALPSLRWGSMVLQSDTQPPVLTLQVFVLGVQEP